MNHLENANQLMGRAMNELQAACQVGKEPTPAVAAAMESLASSRAHLASLDEVPPRPAHRALLVPLNT